MSNDNYEKKGDLVILPGATISPEVLLHKVLEQHDVIENMIIVVQDRDGMIHVQHTGIRPADFALLNLTLDEYTRSGCMMYGDDED